jgi:CheY-like chemotaxis protein
VPILAITAYASAELMAAAQAAGVGDFMLKPVEPEVLYRKLAALMGVSAPATTTVAAAQPEPIGEPLLDEKRLQGYLRLGLLRDLADEFMIGIDRLGARVRDAVEAHDLQSTLDALHSLVGMAGEAGAQALHRRSRELYVPMLETQAWPANDDWVEELRILGQASNRALREFIATHLQAEA